MGKFFIALIGQRTTHIILQRTNYQLISLSRCGDSLEQGNDASVGELVLDESHGPLDPSATEATPHRALCCHTTRSVHPSSLGSNIASTTNVLFHPSFSMKHLIAKLPNWHLLASSKERIVRARLDSFVH
eukprot:1739163-Amphidinium_carterae.1